MFVIAASLLYIDEDSINCDTSYVKLVWWILIFFMWPTIIPFIQNKYIRYAAIAIMTGVWIYVPISYSLTQGCPGEIGMKYFIFSAMITFVIGSIMNYISVKSKESDEEILRKDFEKRSKYILEKLIPKTNEESNKEKEYWEKRLKLGEERDINLRSIENEGM